MKPISDTGQQAKRRGSRQRELLRLEQALLHGDSLDDAALARLSSADLRGSPLLAKARGESLIRSGLLKSGLDLLNRTVKELAAQGQHGVMLDALAFLSMVHIRTGNGAEAATIVRFLREEFARSAAGVPGIIAHALAVGAHLLDDSANRIDYLNAAFDAYAQEPSGSGYGTLLLDVWTGLATPDELPRWESRAAWVQQQVRLGRKWAVYVRCIQGMNGYHAADWREAARLLAPVDGFDLALGRCHASVMRYYRFLARCRGGPPDQLPTESEYRELDLILREEEADLALKFHAEILTQEWLQMKPDPAGAREARRRAEIIAGLTGMPQQARVLAELDAREASAAPSTPPLPSSHETPSPASASGGGWRFFCFGKMRIARAGAEVGEMAWKRRKTKELLVYLLLQPKYEAPKDRVLELLFAGAEPEKAANRLYVAIHELKRTFVSELGLADAIALKEGLVRLNEPMIEYVDIEQYGALARVGEQLWRQDRDLALEMFDQACLLYDDLLPEMPYVDWLDPYRDALLETQAGMLRRLAMQAADEGNTERAESYLSEWLRVKPLQEEAHYEMISLLVNDGRQMEALNGYRRWERICAQELGSMPMPETKQLIARLRP